MPTLEWIGKRAVLNHHRQIPFHLLKTNPDLSVGDPESGNLLVQGDNLLALKALLPYYAGQVKGEHLWSADEAKEKRAVGQLWAERSGGSCIFVMPNGTAWGEIDAAFRPAAH